MDGSLYTAINGLAGHVDTIDDLFEFISNASPYILAGFLVLLWFLPGARELRTQRQWGVITAAISALVALGVNQIIIRIWDRPRPFISLPHTLLLAPSHDPSFPSDHATFTIAVAVALLVATRWAGILALSYALLVGFARVYTGEHYVSDVLAGAVIGALVAIVLSWAKPYLALVLDPPLRLARRWHLA